MIPRLSHAKCKGCKRSFPVWKSADYCLVCDAAIQAGIKPTRKNKYGAVKTANGYPSKLEEAVGDIVHLRVLAGELRNLKRQASVDLGDGIRWKVDFSAERVADGQPIWIEAKGKWSRDGYLKLRLWQSRGPGPLEIWGGHHEKPVLVRTVIPRGKGC